MFTDRLGFSADNQLRTDFGRGDFERLVLRSGLTWKLNDRWTIAGGYVFSELVTPFRSVGAPHLAGESTDSSSRRQLGAQFARAGRGALHRRTRSDRTPAAGSCAYRRWCDNGIPATLTRSASVEAELQPIDAGVPHCRTGAATCIQAGFNDAVHSEQVLIQAVRFTA